MIAIDPGPLSFGLGTRGVMWGVGSVGGSLETAIDALDSMG